MNDMDKTRSISMGEQKINENDETLSTSGNSPLVAAVKKYMALIESGTAPTPDQFCLEHKNIADELMPCLAGLVLVEQGFGKGQKSKLVTPNSTEPCSEPEIPAALGDFRIVREIGRGGMGIVYEAHELSLGRRVALKVLSFASGLDPVRLQRFRNEAQSAAQLHHTHIVPVYAVGADRGVHYYAMQLIEGRSLAQVIAALRQARDSASAKEPSQALDVSNSPSRDTNEVDVTNPMSGRSGRNQHYRKVAKMTVQAAVGLAHAHLYGVIHRDIKPANLMLDPVGNIWITDFGLAQIQTDSNLTRSGDMLGTLRYMSPEQASGGKVPMDHRSDIYSLGITLYELLTLQPAISGMGYQEIVNQIAEHDPVSPRSIDPSIPLELEIIMRKAIAKSPIERYETASLLADDLQRWLDDKPILAKPPTALQRLAKWRRRHSSLVTAAAVFGAITMIGLMLTTIIVFREQLKTSSALANEKQQREVAEVSFQQARRAVDTFSELSETELANRPDLKSLRREFLEASLDFYQDFIEFRGDDPSLQDELSASKQRVEKMVETLTRLDRLEPLQLLVYSSIRKELNISSELHKAIQEFLKGADLSVEEAQFDDSQSVQAANLLAQFEDMSQKLTEPQWDRLRQIHRQLRLPFTFKSVEIAQALGLTQSQKREIVLIIEQERPDRITNRQGRGEMEGPGYSRSSGGSSRPNFQLEPPPHSEPFRDGFRKERGPKGPHPGERGPRGGRGFEQTLFLSQTAKTVDRIIAILTLKQRSTWQELIGVPFDFQGF